LTRNSIRHHADLMMLARLAQSLSRSAEREAFHSPA
jgi:hypothetical protein